MQVCSVCGFKNSDASTRCTRCHSILQTGERTEPPSSSLWKLKLRAGVHSIVGLITLRAHNLGRLVRDRESAQPLSYRFPAVAAILGLLPPLGQLYSRKWKRAVLAGLVFWGLLWFSVETLHHGFNNLLLLALLAVWVTICTDAIVCAIQTNAETWNFRNTVALWFAVLFYVGVAATAFQHLIPTLCVIGGLFAYAILSSLAKLQGRRFGLRAILIVGTVTLILTALFASVKGSGRIYTFIRLTHDLAPPHLQRGDLILVFSGAYWFSEPQLGDVVYFDPPRFVAERPSPGRTFQLVINMKDYFQKLSGIPGDVIEIRNGKMIRNGSSVPETILPFGWDRIPPHVFYIPRQHYFLPATEIVPDSLMGVLGGSSAVPPQLFAQGWIFQGWFEACLVPREAILGKALAIVNPPARRRWF